MTPARTATASGILVRGGTLILALGLVTLASENTSAFPFFNRYYKILNLRTFNPSLFCSKADCESHASDVNIWGQVTGWSRLGPALDTPLRLSEHFAPRRMPQSMLIVPSRC